MKTLINRAINNPIPTGIIALMLITILVQGTRVPTWYEVHEKGVYQCMGIKHEQQAICISVDDQSIQYTQEGVYEVDYTDGGEYLTVHVDDEECAVLRKGYIYEVEAYCAEQGVVDTLTIL